METSEEQIPLKKYIYKIFKTKALSEKFNKPKNIEEIKYLFINNFIDTIYIPFKNDHRTRDKITTMGNYLFPKNEEFWAVTLDSSKINVRFVYAYIKANYLFGFKNINSENISEEDVKNILIKNTSLEEQEILRINIEAALGLETTAKWNIITNLYKPTQLKLDDIIKNIPDLEFEKLITQDESSKHEYKSSLRYNTKEKKLTEWLVDSSIKTIAAFLNTDGGNLLIGINDDKRILGIELDQFKSDDAWVRFLKDKIKSNLGLKYLETYIKIETKKFENKTIGIIKCAALPSNEHCLFKDKLIVRKGPSSHELPVKDALSWVQNRVIKNLDG